MNTDFFWIGVFCKAKFSAISSNTHVKVYVFNTLCKYPHYIYKGIKFTAEYDDANDKLTIYKEADK